MLRLVVNDDLRRTLFGLFVICTMVAPERAMAQSDEGHLLWLQWLGVTNATEQIDRIIDQEIELLTLRQGVELKKVQQLRERLITYSGSEKIQAAVKAFVNQRSSKINIELEEILQKPLMVRARNFDVALEMTGAFGKFNAFNKNRLKKPPNDERLALMKKLDQAQRTSKIAALMQTQINITVGRLMSKMMGKPWSEADPEWLSLQNQQRERHMSEVIVNLHLFSYRFMKDGELNDYIQLMNSPSVQSVLDVAVQGVQESLATARLNTLK